MPKEKVTLTLDSANLAELRRLAGSRSLSATVDAAVDAHVALLSHLAAVDDWIAAMDAQHGPVPSQTLEWAARLIDDWESTRTRPTKAS